MLAAVTLIARGLSVCLKQTGFLKPHNTKLCCSSGLACQYVCNACACVSVPHTDYLAAYYGDQLPALECIKLKYDKEDFFHLPMDIQPSTRSASECAELLKKVGTAAADFSRYLLTAGPAKSDPPSSVTHPTTATPTLVDDASLPRRVATIGRRAMAGRKLV